MSKKEPLSRKLAFGIFYLLSGSSTSLILKVITLGYIARTLEVEKFGLYSAIFSFVYLFQFICNFGLNKALLKLGSINSEKAQISFGNALFIKSILAIPTLATITLLGLMAGYRSEELVILEYFSIGLILDSYASVFGSIRRILGSFKLISFLRVLQAAINLLIIFIALSINNSVLSLALATMLLSFVIFIISLSNTLFLLKPKLQLSLLSEFFKDSAIFSFSDFFSNVYARIGVVLLSFFNNLHLVGIYSAAIRFTRIANLLPAQIKFALLPSLYRMFEEDSEQRQKRVFKIILKYMVIFATPLAISIYFFSDTIIHIVFGKKYDLAIPLVQLFSIFIYLRFLETPFNLFYTAMHKHVQFVSFQGITSFLNVVLNIVLIPLYSVYGACASTLISEASFALMVIFNGEKHIWSTKDVFTAILKPLVAGIISLVIITTLLIKINVFIQILFLLLLYLVFLLITKTFNKEDKELLLKIFSTKKLEPILNEESE